MAAPHNARAAKAIKRQLIGLNLIRKSPPTDLTPMGNQLEMIATPAEDFGEAVHSLILLLLL